LALQERVEAQVEAFEDTWHRNDSAEGAFDEVIQSGNTDAAEMLRAMRSVTLRNPGVRPNLHFPCTASNGVIYQPIRTDGRVIWKGSEIRCRGPGPSMRHEDHR
jgi:hypothetical protein